MPPVNYILIGTANEPVDQVTDAHLLQGWSHLKPGIEHRLASTLIDLMLRR